MNQQNEAQIDLTFVGLIHLKSEQKGYVTHESPLKKRIALCLSRAEAQHNESFEKFL